MSPQIPLSAWLETELTTISSRERASMSGNDQSCEELAKKGELPLVKRMKVVEVNTENKSTCQHHRNKHIHQIDAKKQEWCTAIGKIVSTD